MMEHPFYGSWGYQTTGYFAPDQPLRHAAGLHVPDRHLHQHGIGVILDWVPVALPDRRARPRLLRRHAPLRARRPAPGLPPRLEQLHLQLRPQRGAQLPAVAARSSGCDAYHVDGLRVDAVASMLYLDYSRQAGRVDPEPATAAARTSRRSPSCAASTRRSTAHHPDVQTIAEESTAWPMVSRPTYVGGLGFGFKWDMGWMHDTLGVHAARPGPPQVPPQRAHLPHALRLHRELRPAAVARRGRARQGLAARQDAGRRLAEVRQPAPAARLPVDAAGQEAALHGRRVRPVARVEPRDEPRLAPARRPRARRPAALGARPEHALPRRARACTSSTAMPRGFEWIDCHDADQSTLTFLRRGRRRRRGRASSPATSPRCRATTTASACRAAATGASC